MSTLWSYFWPAFAAGLAIGALVGLVGYRRGRRSVVISAALAGALGAAVLWHWPLGGADRFAATVDHDIRDTLIYYEMQQVSARLETQPLTRRVLLSGPADDFQQGELVRVISDLPGVSSASWSNAGFRIPLLGEAAIAALVGCLLGLMLSYLVELRRRYNAQWRW